MSAGAAATRAAPLERIRIVLVGTSHPGNIGSAARAMLAMGLAQLALVAPQRFPDPEATARAVGAGGVLRSAVVADSLDAALAGCVFTIGFTARAREFAGRVLPLRDAAREAVAHTAFGDVALVFGNEMSGLSNAELERCAVVATIPANPDFASLNVAAAIQVACYELRIAAVGSDVWSAPRFAPARADEIAMLYDHAARTLEAMRLLNPGLPGRLLPRLRRLFARAGLEKAEVDILRGVLARIDQLMERNR